MCYSRPIAIKIFSYIADNLFSKGQYNKSILKIALKEEWKIMFENTPQWGFPVFAFQSDKFERPSWKSLLLAWRQLRQPFEEEMLQWDKLPCPNKVKRMICVCLETSELKSSYSEKEKKKANVTETVEIGGMHSGH